MSALPVPMDEAEARRVTARIRLLLDQIADNTGKVLDLIEQVRGGSAWQPMGYEPWTAYVGAEFGRVLARLSRDDRLPAVVKMRELGMSTRAIGEVVGVDHATVVRDLSRGGADAPPDQPVTGMDGKRYVRNGKPTARGMQELAAVVPPPARRRAPAPVDPAPGPGPLAERTGTTEWSSRVQAVSSECPMEDLTDDEVRELLGAATFLRDYCHGELALRGASDV